MRINDFSENLSLNDGIWMSPGATDISYPASGNDHCFQIEDNSFWFRHRNDCIISLVRKFSPDQTFFDIGGGNGFVAQALEQNGIESVLVEPGISGCRNAQKRSLRNIICSAFADTSFKDASIPAAGLFDVIEHIKDDHAFLQLLHRKMNDNGVLYINVPAYNWLWSQEDVDADHFRRYSRKSIRRLLRENGFQTIYITSIFSILPPALFVLRTLPSLFRRKRNIDSVAALAAEQQHHREKKGMFTSLTERIWNTEKKRIERGAQTRFGSSILLVAKKLR